MKFKSLDERYLSQRRKFSEESVAVREFLATHADSYEMLSVRHARQPSLVLKKVR